MQSSMLGYILLSVLCLAINISSVSAKTNKVISHKTYTVKDGLTNNYIHNFVTDSKGFLWIGTHDGLNRFDGYQFKSYRGNSKVIR